MQAADIRKAFLDFFQGKEHLLVPSSSLIPAGDPTLLLTSAGMVQFKPYFTGETTPPQPRLTSVQKCFRVSDIDSVGDTSHLTFFEMLGNFSIGNYFKKEAIEWAWEFITQHMELPPDRLWATVFLDDDEAHQLWQETGIPAGRIRRFGEEDNWWGPAGNEGPCGPCSEVHYDFGGTCRLGKRDADCGPNCECGRFLELWNLVFMQFYQDPEGKRTPLPRPNIDTGMGLERAALILQDASSIYETDLFVPIVQRVSQLANKPYGKDEETDVAIRVVAEHARAAAFLISDGVVPSNEGRGYVLRRIIRRAIRYGSKLGLESANRGFLAQVAGVVIQHMGAVYPELTSGREFVLRVLEDEEQQFDRVLQTGYTYLDNITVARAGGTLTGEELFKLHDTYGFPVEVTAEIAREHDLAVDMEGFEREMAAQQERSRAAGQKFGGDMDAQRVYQELGIGGTRFLGYETTTAPSVVVALLVNPPSGSVPPQGGNLERRGSSSIASVEKASQGQQVETILGETPFYAEGGGQVGDAGSIEGPQGQVQVEGTQSPLTGLIVHRGSVAQGIISVGDTVVATVDPQRRMDAARNHTATHLLHAALRQVLGTHVRQQGSLVAPDRLRFDFTHVSPLSQEELQQVEELVNDRIRANVPVRKRETAFRQAVAEGALAFFGERYGDQVRVVEVANGPSLEVPPKGEPAQSAGGGSQAPSTGSGQAGAFSFEVCGGTHVNATGDIGLCHVTGESSIGAGLRRIEAVTGRAAEAMMRDQGALLGRVAHQLEASPQDLETRVASLVEEVALLRRQASTQQRASSRQQAQTLLEQVREVNGIKIVTDTAQVSSAEALREVGDWLRDKLGSGVVVLGAIVKERPTLLVMATPDLVDKGIHAGNVVKEAAKVMGGGGGGRPEMAQAGGRQPDKLEDALRLAVEVVARQIGGE